MNQPHIIRLRGPWQRTVSDLPNGDVAAAKTTVQMPESWIDDLGADFAGVVCYTRMFNRPTGIDESTDIRLRLLRVVGKHTEIRLNGKRMGGVHWPDESAELDLSGRLEPRNCLEVEITSLVNENNQPRPANLKLDGAGLVDEVHLEIR